MNELLTHLKTTYSACAFRNARLAILALVVMTAAVSGLAKTCVAQTAAQAASGFSPNSGGENRLLDRLENRLSNVGPGTPVSPRGPAALPNRIQAQPAQYPLPLPTARTARLNELIPAATASPEMIPAQSTVPAADYYFRPAAPVPSPATQTPASQNSPLAFNDLLTEQAEQLITREGTGSSVKIAVLLAALSLAPALILMTTCYVRVVVVLTLLRQAFGAQQLPSTQILTALSLFVTFLVMAPTWNEIKTEAIDPYAAPDSQMSFEEAINRAVVPVKRFMSQQIRLAKNEESVAMFYRYLPQNSGALAGTSQSMPRPSSLEEVPLNVLMPAFLVSELKVAFLLGFQVFLPFLIVDLVVSSVTVSMGMVMLPPTMVSFPLKLILFVMVDGWTLVVGMLMQSFGPL